MTKLLVMLSYDTYVLLVLVDSPAAAELLTRSEPRPFGLASQTRSPPRRLPRASIPVGMRSSAALAAALLAATATAAAAATPWPEQQALEKVPKHNPELF